MTDSLSRTAARDDLTQALLSVGRGDRPALKFVYDRTAAKLFGLCLRILGERAEAEDALQEVYLIVWRKAGTFDAARASPVTWLTTLARNRAIDRLRSGRRLRNSEPIEQASEVKDETPDALAQLEVGEDRSRLHACVDELDARQAQAIRTAFFEGATYVDLAERESVPLGTMKSWIRRSLLKLRECLER